MGKMHWIFISGTLVMSVLRSSIPSHSVNVSVLLGDVVGGGELFFVFSVNVLDLF